MILNCAMIPKNQNCNLSVLPIYSSIDMQNHRKSYAYGAIYPLVAPANRLLPFQAIREQRDAKGELMGSDDFDNGYITEDGTWKQDTTQAGVYVYEISGQQSVYIEKCPSAWYASILQMTNVMAAAYDKDGVLLQTYNPRPDTPGIFPTKYQYSGILELPEGTTQLKIQLKNLDVSEEIGQVYTVVPDPIVGVSLCRPDGMVVEDVTDRLIAGGLTVKRMEDSDIIVFPANADIEALPEGQYYLEMDDSNATYFSEIFTVVKDISGYLSIEWYDDEDLISDSGSISYTAPEYRNIVYLCTELGKPDYDFEEEGEDRDGYFFAEKQISTKVYKFSFIAPEYLCDVMRLIRLSDHVKITSKGITYTPDNFLLTVNWQDQGDIAAVDVEFNNFTVVKKIGLGYIRSIENQ